MNDQYISIQELDSPNPSRRRIFEVNFFSKTIITTVTSTPAVVRDWIRRIRWLHRYRRHKLVVGLGVQWRPSYSGSQPPAATLQLCVGSNCLIFQLLHTANVPRALRRFLADDCRTFVGVWNQNDESMLTNSYHNLWVSKLVDARDVAAERRGLSKNLSMERLAAILLGADNVTKPMSVRMSDWDAYWLSPEQVQYACVDAFVSFELGKELKAWDWED